MAILFSHILRKNQNQKQHQQGGGRLLLITVSVPGSAGPLRFLVGVEEIVAAVIDKALRSYAREGRLPVLGSDLDGFLLYCANSGSDALSPWETIGSCGIRNFLLCKKEVVMDAAGSQPPSQPFNRKKSGSWMAWLNRSLHIKVGGDFEED